MIDHPIGKFGWGLPNETTSEKRLFEGRFLDRIVSETPDRFKVREEKKLRPEVEAKFNKLQDECGRGPNSCDMTLLVYFVFGKHFHWFPQDIGSCVWSNPFRAIVARAIFEISLRGDPEEYFGMQENGIRSIAPHAVQYGFARQLGNMRGGDGLYCSVMGKSLLNGMIMCSTPKLIELMKKAGADGPNNFPEPRNPELYRAIGDWRFNDELRPFLSSPLLECPPVTNFDTHFELSKAFKPVFQCSMIAIKRVGKHKDGFAIHERDPNNSWAHCMVFMGHFYASDGSLWFRFSNLSWLNDPNPESSGLDETNVGRDPLPNWNEDREKYIYNISADHLRGWYTRKLVDSMAIGEIDLPDSMPATV